MVALVTLGDHLSLREVDCVISAIRLDSSRPYRAGGWIASWHRSRRGADRSVCIEAVEDSQVNASADRAYKLDLALVGVLRTALVLEPKLLQLLKLLIRFQSLELGTL